MCQLNSFGRSFPFRRELCLAAREMAMVIFCMRRHSRRLTVVADECEVKGAHEEKRNGRKATGRRHVTKPICLWHQRLVLAPAQPAQRRTLIRSSRRVQNEPFAGAVRSSPAIPSPRDGLGISTRPSGLPGVRVAAVCVSRRASSDNRWPRSLLPEHMTAGRCRASRKW